MKEIIQKYKEMSKKVQKQVENISDLSNVKVNKDISEESKECMRQSLSKAKAEKLELINSGDCNSGYCNSGDYNSGDCNSGYCNSGDRNSGYWNSGNRNLGDRNSGNWNSGNYNSGNSNSGDRNSGSRNSGNYNSGNWNSGNRNSGFFNSDEPCVRMFNKMTNFKEKDIKIPSWCYFDLTVWVSHDTATEEEKTEHKAEIEICGGFLKKINYKDAWRIAWNRASIEERKELFDLPNWDNQVFKEITGIDAENEIRL